MCFLCKVEDYSLIIMTHYHDLETYGKITYKDVIKKDKEGYKQQEIDRFNISKEIFETQILDKFGEWKKIRVSDLKINYSMFDR